MITVQFHLPVTRIDRLVSYLGKTKYCHVSIAYQIAGQWWCAEALARTGVRIYKLSAKPNPDAYAFAPIFPIMAEEWIARHIGEKFGFLDCLCIGIRKWTGWRIGGNVRGIMCAELVSMMMNDFHLYDIDDTDITPDELAARMGVAL